MSKKRYATCTCEYCYAIVPKNEAFEDIVTEESGTSSGSSSPRYIMGDFSNYYRSQRTYERTFYRNRKIWICLDCMNKLNEQQIYEDMMREKEYEKFKSNMKPFVVFFSACVILFLILLLAPK